jgi:WD40 repeat protein
VQVKIRLLGFGRVIHLTRLCGMWTFLSRSSYPPPTASDIHSTANSEHYRSSKILPFETVVWRVSWSLSGNVLAVSAGDNKVSLWKENLRGEWECVKNIEE